MLYSTGICDDGRLVADVAELLFSFESVEKFLLSHDSTEFWCWPVKWLIDVTEQFVFYYGQRMFMKKQAFERLGEFGVSAASGTIKVKLNF
jgi:hypothetical protein